MTSSLIVRVVSSPFFTHTDAASLAMSQLDYHTSCSAHDLPLALAPSRLPRGAPTPDCAHITAARARRVLHTAPGQPATTRLGPSHSPAHAQPHECHLHYASHALLPLQLWSVGNTALRRLGRCSISATSTSIFRENIADPAPETPFWTFTRYSGCWWPPEACAGSLTDVFIEGRSSSPLFLSING